MKKLIGFVGMAVLALSSNAQSGSERSNAVKLNLFSPIVKTGSFFYERKLSEKSTAQLGVGFTAYNRSGIGINGLFITPEYRIYLSNEAMNGFYVGPYLRYQNLTIKDKESDPDEESKATLTTYGGGVVIGRQWLFSDRITFDIFAGPNYNSGTVKIKSGSDVDVPGSFKGFGARVGLTLGVAF